MYVVFCELGGSHVVLWEANGTMQPPFVGALYPLTTDPGGTDGDQYSKSIVALSGTE
jgi:hypothetical protein